MDDKKKAQKKRKAEAIFSIDLRFKDLMVEERESMDKSGFY